MGDRFEDEVELMDYLRVMWKWKWLIVLGAFVCAVAAGAMSFWAPKVYRFDMLVEPGILTVERGGKNVYIDSSENMEAIIDAGTFNKEILRNIDGPKNNLPQTLKFNVRTPRRANVVKVSYETSDVERGLRILEELGVVLLKKYAERVTYFQNEYETQIDLKETERAHLEAERQASEWHIKNLEQRIDKLQEEIASVRKSMGALVQKRNTFVPDDVNEGNATSAIFYTTAMQQNIALENSYRMEVDNYTMRLEDEKLRLKKIDIDLRGLSEEIENLKLGKNNIQNVQILQPPTKSPRPVKPKVKLNIMLGLAGGLFLMVFVAFFLEYLSGHKTKKC